MISQGLQLMALGMGTVFAFLGLLVLTMHASAAYFRHFGDTFPEVASPAAAPQSADAEIAVVLAAIAAHRSRT